MTKTVLESRWAVAPWQTDGWHREKLARDYMWWQADTKPCWPAEIQLSGARFYMYDRKKRELCALVRVDRGGAFRYRSHRAFIDNIERITGEKPGVDDCPWPEPKPGYGLAVSWRRTDVELCSVPIAVKRVPSNMWIDLTRYGEVIDADSATVEERAEGTPVLQKHLIYERDPELRRRAVAHWKKRLGGKIYCQCCGFSFDQAFALIGADYIEMHHKVPLFVKAKKTLNSSADAFVPLCANCHRMVHRLHGDVAAVEEVRAALTNPRRAWFVTKR